MNIKHASCKTKIYWKCLNRSSSGCWGSMMTNLHRKHPEPGQPHNHLADQAQIHLAKVKKQMKDQAARTQD